MGAVLDLINKLRSEAPIPKQEAAILDIVEENKNLIVDLNTGQLMEGLDANAQYLRDYHNPQYALFKLSLNPRGVTDLKLRGNFHRGFYLTADKWPVVFNSTDRKRDNLTEQYGPDIFGLTEKSKTIVAFDYLKASIQEYYRRLLQL